MSGEAERGTRFARDLRRIRRARGVSLADIHDATKMAYDMIKRFEHDALINHPQFNKIYLRLFVRGYAEHLDMDVEMTLGALELAIKGQYTGSLAKAYLGESEEERKEEAPKQEKKTSPAKPAAPESDQVTEATPPVHTGKGPAKSAQKKSTAPAPKTTVPKTIDSATTAPETSPAEQPSARKDPVAKTSAAREGTLPIETSDPGASVRVGAGPSKGASPQASDGSDGSSGPDSRWVFLAVLIVVIGLVIWGLARMGSGPDGSAQESSPVTELVEPANDITDATVPAPAISLQSLPDTLNITIVADKGGVAPIRVTVDNDLRRPYWITRGNSMTFRMTDRIVLEQQLDSVTVQVEGMTYPVSRPTGVDMVTLTRGALRSWFSSIQP